jgi:small subunit ribosomal protein S16
VVKIRLARHGNKKNPIYRVVVADSREPRDGKTLETIGRYNPQMDPSLIEIDTDRANAWIANGAQPTEQVASQLKIAGNATAAGA